MTEETPEYPAPKSLSKSIEMCTTGWIHYRVWTELLEQRKPKATAKEISEAKRAYIYHRENCGICTPWMKEFN
jgi:hypothetical protein